jgi:hypothetical protein
MKAPFDIEAFLKQPFYGLNILTILGDVEDFIEFSEGNIDRQKAEELQRTTQECDALELDDPHFATQYREQKLEGVEYRFEVSLRQKVRYAALTTLITSIEWALLALKKRASFEFPKKKDSDKTNETVHILRVFNQKASLSLEPQVQSLERLVHVRNCIAHAAGLLGSYKYELELRKSLKSMSGIKVSSINFLGESIEVEPSFLIHVVDDAKIWLPKLQQSVSDQGLLHKF